MNMIEFSNLYKSLCLYLADFLDLQMIGRMGMINKHWSKMMKIHLNKLKEQYINKDHGEHKLIIIGEYGVGKKTLLKRFNYSNFNKKYVATIGAEIYPFHFKLNFGKIIMDCCAYSGNEKFGRPRDAFYIGSKAVIIMFDVTSRVTYKKVSSWYKDATRVLGENVPVVIVGNKIDVSVLERKVKPKQIDFPKRKNLPYFEISAKSNYNTENLFLEVSRLVIGVKNGVEFVERPLLCVPCTTVDLERANLFRKEYDEYVPPIEDEDDF
eukprot:TRINITY_DN2185_c0_g1_i1.p1 TRINITY_DN2185_c0_g1~~TRINITY_DN2185_c0_g1_i1.p1  ORF type:complete len:267 (+),score=67.56 TRINITY_DN2185_c0_g1_i1:46-846(+)